MQPSQINRTSVTPVPMPRSRINSKWNLTHVYHTIPDDDQISYTSMATISSLSECQTYDEHKGAASYLEESDVYAESVSTTDSQSSSDPSPNDHETFVKLPQFSKQSSLIQRTSTVMESSAPVLQSQRVSRGFTARERSNQIGSQSVDENRPSVPQASVQLFQQSSEDGLLRRNAFVKQRKEQGAAFNTRSSAPVKNQDPAVHRRLRPQTYPRRAKQSVKNISTPDSDTSLCVNKDGSLHHRPPLATPVEAATDDHSQVLVPLSNARSRMEEKTFWKKKLFKHKHPPKHSKLEISTPSAVSMLKTKEPWNEKFKKQASKRLSEECAKFDIKRHVQHGRYDQSGRTEIVGESFLNTFGSMQVGDRSSRSTSQDARNVGAHLRVLEDQFKGLLKENRWTDAGDRDANFTQVVQNQYSAEECLKNAKESRRSNQFFRAFLYSNAAANLYRNVSDSSSGMIGIEESVSEMKKVAVEMMQRQDLDLAKLVIRHHVIPIMTYKRHDIRTLIGVPETLRCLSEVWALHCIEFCQSLIGDLNGEKETLNIALSNMRRTLGDSATKFHVYGLCLHNLGIVHHNQSNFNKAAALLLSALKAKAIANDYESDKEKESDIAITTNVMSNVDKALWLIKPGTGNVPVLV